LTRTTTHAPLQCPIALSYPSSSFPPPLQERKSPRSLSSYALAPTPFASQSQPSPRLTAFGTKSSLVKLGCPVYLRTSVSCGYSSTSIPCAGIQVFFVRPVWFTLKGSVGFVLVTPPHFSPLCQAVRGKSATREKESEGFPLRQGAHQGGPSGTGVRSTTREPGPHTV
jgi:hypothetical protein